MKHTNKKNKRLIRVLAGVVCGSTILLSSFNPFIGTGRDLINKSYALGEKSETSAYLSSLEYVSELSSGTIIIDKMEDGSKLTILVEGADSTFDRGLFASVPSEIVYDLSKDNYENFSTLMGFRSDSFEGEGKVKVSISTSEDGEVWDEAKVEELHYGEAAKLVNINIKGSSYLKIKNESLIEGAEAYIIFADAKLTKQEIKLVDCITDATKCDFEDNQKDFASFSFDGADANTIVLNKKFDSTLIKWEYSLDSGKNWVQTEEHEVHLTDEELDKITSEDDIRLHIVGLDDKIEKNIYTIDIQNAEYMPKLYNNDWENALIGDTSVLEWTFDQKEGWTDYKQETPDLKGNKYLIVRTKKTGVYLSGEPITFTFTDNESDKTQQYIPISSYKLEEASGEDEDYPAKNAIDGNINTDWKSTVSNKEEKEHLTIALDRARFISRVEIISTTDTVKKLTIWASLDKENWKEIETLEYKKDQRLLDSTFTDEVKAQYIKIVFDEYNSVENEVASIAILNIYEDATISHVPTASISYDIASPTNQNVTAKLVNPNRKITITSEGGDTHVFEKNGEFKFTFVDEYGVEGEAIAKVDWIDKVAPIVSLEYDIKTSTKNPVTVTIKGVNEEIIITNNGGSNTYTFKENGSFTFYFMDKAGNTGMTIATVDWIVKDVVQTPSTGKPSTKPSTGTSSGSSSNGGNSSGNSTGGSSSNNPSSIDGDEYTYTIDNITIEIPKLNTKEKLTLAKDNLVLTKTLEAKVGNESEYFELYLKDENSNKKDVKANIEMTIKLDSSKKFLGIFSVDEEGSITKLEYSTIGSNKIRVDVDSLGEFIISYDSTEEEEEEEPVKESNNIIGTIVVLGVLIAVGIVIYIKNKED